MADEIKRAREFVDAAYKRNYVGMRKALKSDDDTTLHSVDDAGNTALHYAVFAKADSSGDYRDFNKQSREVRDQNAEKMVKFLLVWRPRRAFLVSVS